MTKDRTTPQAVDEHIAPEVVPGSYAAHVQTTLEELRSSNIIARIWRKDHSVWRPDPRDIANRLGWLNVIKTMRDQVPDLLAFAEEIKGAEFRHVVLLGMGGSSLGPEVLRRTFGNAKDFPELIVLDSTLPARVMSVTDTVDPSRTLFIVSSKSGETIETNSLYAHFRHLAEGNLGKYDAGASFVAITDEGTPLEELASKEGFRRTFLNPPDMGGRYSVLSYFGLVPAAVLGMDILTLLDRAEDMRLVCASRVPASANHAAGLGAAMGAAALMGRDKLTLVTSPSVTSFGLWAEQLIAESLGKQGKGIIPIVGESLASPDSYAEDRMFVYLREECSDNTKTDDLVEQMESTGLPVVRLELQDKYDLGAEFFRWELATAIAASVIGVHPFNEPNVRAAKEMTNGVLQGFARSGRLIEVETTPSLRQALARAGPGDYLAVMAFVNETSEIDRALQNLRTRVRTRYQIATTLGYGPRFLHSTGQLHKGGRPSGIFLQITANHEGDVTIPREPYTFGVLADAQALGDLQAFQSAGLRFVQVHLDSEVAAGIKRLTADLTKESD